MFIFLISNLCHFHSHYFLFFFYFKTYIFYAMKNLFLYSTYIILYIKVAKFLRKLRLEIVWYIYVYWQFFPSKKHEIKHILIHTFFTSERRWLYFVKLWTILCFADDRKLFMRIDTVSHCIRLQSDPDRFVILFKALGFDA